MLSVLEGLWISCGFAFCVSSFRGRGGMRQSTQLGSRLKLGAASQSLVGVEFLSRVWG